MTLCNNLSSNSTTLDLDTALSGADVGGTWAETTGSPSGSFDTFTGVFDAEGLAAGVYILVGGADNDDRFFEQKIVKH